VWVVLLLVLVLHEAIVEVWRRRSGVRVILTGIVRVLGLALALAVAVLALAVRGILLLLLLLLLMMVETWTSRAPGGSAGGGRTSI
jgi:hypothetical protein